MATNEQIKKWYSDFKAKLKECGVDIDTLGGRMAVVAFFANPVEKVNNRTYSDDRVTYAFAMTDEHGNYNNPMPKQKQVHLSVNDYKNEKARYKEEADRLYNQAGAALKSNKRQEAIRLNAEAKQLLEKAQNEEVKRLQFEREQYSERIDWLKENLAPLDPENEADMEHIRYLYELAEHGNLGVKVDNLDSEDWRLVYVQTSGECGVTVKMDDLKKYKRGKVSTDDLLDDKSILVSTDDICSYFRDFEETRDAYEKRFNCKFPDMPSEQDYADVATKIMEHKLNAVNAGEIGNNIAVNVIIAETSARDLNPEKVDEDELQNERIFDIEMLRGERSIPGYVDLSTDDPAFVSIIKERVLPGYEKLHESYINKQEQSDKAGDKELEKVQKWFRSMKEQLGRQGCDIDTTEGMLMLQSFKMADGTYVIPRYAMMNMDKNMEYLVPDPSLKPADIDEYLKYMQSSHAAINESEKLYQKAAKAIEDNDEEAAKQYSEEAESATQRAEADKKKYYEKANKAYKKHDEWLLNNLKPIDPDNPADWDRMKLLYNSAKEGLLGRYTNDDNNLTQIYLKMDGTCGITTDSANLMIKAPTLSECENPGNNNIIFTANDWYTELKDNPELKRAYEQKYNVELVERIELPVKPVAPGPVQAPGTRSWLKRIFSFGLAHGDFDRYEEYLQEKSIYEDRIKEYSKLERDYINNRALVNKQMEEVAQRLGKNAYQGATEKIAKYSKNLGMMLFARNKLTIDMNDAEATLNICLFGHDAELIKMANSDNKGVFSKDDLHDGEYHISKKLNDIQMAEVAEMCAKPQKQFETGLFNSKLIRDAGNLSKELFDNAPLRNTALSRLYKSYDSENDNAAYEGDNADVMIKRFLSESNDYVNLFEKGSDVYKEIDQLGRKYAQKHENADEKSDYFDAGMCIVAGILQNIDKKAFGSMTVYGLLKDGGFTKLSEKYAESMDSLCKNAVKNLFKEDGSIDNEKYANALCNVIRKCNYNVFSRPEEGLSIYKISQAALTTKLYDILKSKGYEDGLSKDDKALCQSASGISFTYMASDAGEIAVHSLHSYSGKSDEKLRCEQLKLLSEYGTIISATVLGQQLKNAYKSKNWAEIAAFSSRKEYLIKIEKAKSALVNAPTEVLDNLRDENVMKVFADYIDKDKPITAKILEAARGAENEPAQSRANS